MLAKVDGVARRGLGRVEQRLNVRNKVAGKEIQYYKVVSRKSRGLRHGGRSEGKGIGVGKVNEV